MRAANHAINRLDPLVSIELITGTTARRYRKDILNDLRTRKLDAVAAPRVLDEGVDVPDANLGIVMSASRTRRQMIQRMGRILRRKRAGVGARFVIMFARDTMEDPAMRFERDGFLDEIERISEAASVFHAERFEEIDEFLATPGPAVVLEPTHLGPYRAADSAAELADPELAALLAGNGDAWATLAAQVASVPGTLADVEAVEDVVRAWSARLGPERLYAAVSMVRWDGAGALHDVVWRVVEPLLSKPDPDDAPYVELELDDLPIIAKPKVEPKRLSTGQAPLEIASVGIAWQMRCTGCGGASPLVRFRWQVLDQTVACRCA